MSSDLAFKGSHALRLYSCEVLDLRGGEDVCWSFLGYDTMYSGMW